MQSLLPCCSHLSAALCFHQLSVKNQNVLTIWDGGANSPATAVPYRFLLRSFRFPGAAIVPHPPSTIKISRELRPSRALQGLFDSLEGAVPFSERLPVVSRPYAGMAIARRRGQIVRPGARLKKGRLLSFLRDSGKRGRPAVFFLDPAAETDGLAELNRGLLT